MSRPDPTKTQANGRLVRQHELQFEAGASTQEFETGSNSVRPQSLIAILYITVMREPVPLASAGSS